jgi:hypothetical protein
VRPSKDFGVGPGYDWEADNARKNRSAALFMVARFGARWTAVLYESSRG